MQAVKDALARARGPEGDGLASYRRLIKEARDLFQALTPEEQQNLRSNLPQADIQELEVAQNAQGGRRKHRRTMKKSKRRQYTRRHR